MVVAMALIPVQACGDDSAVGQVEAADSVSVTDATVTKPVSGQPNAGVFATVTNNTARDVKITAATSSLSDDVQLHLTVEGDGGTMSMQQVDSIEVAAGQIYRFEHGGPHIMLMNIDADTFPADTVDVTLQLDDGTEIPFTAAVETLEMSDMPDSTHMPDATHMTDS